MKKNYSMFVLVLTVMMLSLNLVAQEKNASSDRVDLTGTWLVNVEIESADKELATAAVTEKFPAIKSIVPSPNMQSPFTTVETFTSDGIFTENGLTDYFPPQTTPGHGVWGRTGEREFALTFYGVQIGSSINPEFQGTFKVRSQIKLNRRGDEFTAPSIVDLYAPNGSFIFSFRINAYGRRASIERLP